MEIIKQPTRYREHCSLCGCVFSFHKGEIEYYFGEQWIKCPACKDKRIARLDQQLDGE